jgi:hypothetical protein
MFKHKIGKVFLYNVPPGQAQFDVRIPLFNEDDQIAPELLLQIQDEALTPRAQRRKQAITDASALPSGVLSMWAEFGIDELNRLAEDVKSELEEPTSLLNWKGVPSFDQVEATFALPWNILDFQKHDIRSPRQLAHYANRLRVSISIRDYLNGFVTSTGLAAQPEIDRCFNFMRGAEYTFPQVLRALNDVIDAVVGEGVVNYRVYAAQLQNLFLPGELRALDEFGVPFPLIERLSAHLPADDVEASRRQLERPNPSIRNTLSSFEIDLLARGLA